MPERISEAAAMVGRAVPSAPSRDWNHQAKNFQAKLGSSNRFPSPDCESSNTASTVERRRGRDAAPYHALTRITHSHVAVACISFLLVFLSGCAVGPDYHRPPVNVPQNFRNAPPNVTTNSLADLPWWQVFKDDALQRLVRVALTNNYDLRIAVSRVEQSRALLEQNKALFFPQLNYTGGVSRGKNAVGLTPTFTGVGTENSVVIGGNASWELDLWGRIRRLNESARAQLFATEEGRRDVMISLISQVAQNYFQLLALDRQLEIARRTTNSFNESLRIFSQRLQSGIVSKLETSRAEAALASTAATVPDLERQIIIKENQISILLGLTPAAVPRGETLLDELVPAEVPAGLPSTLLERRPDIRQAEELLHSANAQIGVATADFFPQINLTGVLGAASPELFVFNNGASAWSVAAGLTGPIFHGGQLVGQLHQTKAARQEAALRYQETILNALQEVSNDLISRQKFAESRVQQVRAVNAYREAVKVSTDRYIAGKASYFEVLEAQQQLFPAENSLVQIELNQLSVVVQLYTALGGGWDYQHPQIDDGRHRKASHHRR